MGRQIVNIVIRFVFLILLQGLVLNNVDLFGFITPYLYVSLIILLPLEFNPSVVLLFSFVVGLSIDMFTMTWGMHTAASVFVAFCRPLVLRVLAPRDGFVTGITPSMSYMGINWFLLYAFVMILLHHVFLFYTEVFRFSEFFFTLGRALASVFFTYLLVLISEFLTFRQIRTL
ncbi:MAG: rod shape-determining protein MreD [Salibacteraceae bacterium]